jgi:hypothetical protein
MRKRTARLAWLASLTLLAACGADTARTLGFTRDAPDEFQVVTRAPLAIPPTLGDLPPPRPGAPRPQEAAARERAEGILAPAAVLQPAASARQSGAEAALLAESGRTPPADIRRRVDEESTRLDRPRRDLVDSILFWREPPPPGVAVDPERESQRLRENAALGRDSASGETPIIQRRRAGLFEGLF